VACGQSAESGTRGYRRGRRGGSFARCRLTFRTGLSNRRRDLLRTTERPAGRSPAAVDAAKVDFSRLASHTEVVMAGQVAREQVPQHDVVRLQLGRHRWGSKRDARVWPRCDYRHDDRNLLALAAIFRGTTQQERPIDVTDRARVCQSRAEKCNDLCRAGQGQGQEGQEAGRREGRNQWVIE
jgi:hypothetical protein